MADNVSFNNKIQDNISINITSVNKVTKIKMKEIPVNRYLKSSFSKCNNISIKI